MDPKKIREQVRGLIAAKLAERKTHTDQIAVMRAAVEAGDATVTAEQVREAVSKRSALDAELDQLEARDKDLTAEIERDDAMARLQAQSFPTPRPGERSGVPHDRAARVGQEPRTYTQQTGRDGVSYFRDLYAITYLPTDRGARERMERYATEVRVEGELDGMSTRATTTSSFSGLIPPQYLVDEVALLQRAGRPVANSVRKLELPDEGMSLIVPRGTTGASAAVQATENSNVSSTDEVWANVTVPVATIAGQQDVSRQSLERGYPGIDQLIFTDLMGAYFVALDQQVISGTGSAGQMLGILNTAGINQSTAFIAAATPATFYSKTGGQLNAIETTRFLAPDIIWMHPRRWNWLLTQLDSSNRPLAVPRANGPFNAMATYDGPVDTPSSMAVGTLFGLPVVTDASIPTAVGSGPEDQAIVARWEDLLLWEDGDGTPRDLRFEQTLGNQLTVKLVAYGYAAFTAGRFPTAVGVVGGNSAGGFGLIAPTF